MFYYRILLLFQNHLFLQHLMSLLIYFLALSLYEFIFFSRVNNIFLIKFNGQL